MAIPNTIFEKELSTTDEKIRLAIPMKNFYDFPAIPEGETQVIVPVTDEDEREWNFYLSKRKDGHPKPVISGADWKSYVTENQLRQGDKITFYKANGEANEIIKIKVSRRAVRLFGAIIG